LLKKNGNFTIFFKYGESRNDYKETFSFEEFKIDSFYIRKRIIMNEQQLQKSREFYFVNQKKIDFTSEFLNVITNPQNYNTHYHDYNKNKNLIIQKAKWNDILKQEFTGQYFNDAGYDLTIFLNYAKFLYKNKTDVNNQRKHYSEGIKRYGEDYKICLIKRIAEEIEKFYDIIDQHKCTTHIIMYNENDELKLKDKNFVGHCNTLVDIIIPVIILLVVNEDLAEICKEYFEVDFDVWDRGYDNIIGWPTKFEKKKLKI
jgi:hypothetical protein